MLSIEEYKARWAETEGKHWFDAILREKDGSLYVWEDITPDDLQWDWFPVDEAMFFDREDMVGYHKCTYSAVWDDLPEGWEDAPTDVDLSLPDGKYIVVWYKCDENHDLRTRCDWNISKNRILHHIRNQRYVEGANYYLMPDLKEGIA